MLRCARDIIGMEKGVQPALQRALAGEERLWKIWWLCGIPLAGLVSAMTVFADHARDAGYAGWGDLLDIIRLLAYFLWCRLAWGCSRNVDERIWTPISRFALAAGLVLVVLI